MVCKTVKQTIIAETDRENVSYPSKCFYFTCIVEGIYNTTVFFKVLYLFVKIDQHKQDTRKRREKAIFPKYNKRRT